MGLEFLVRVRKSSLWLAAVASLMTATYAGPAHGLAIGLGALWSLANLALIQLLVVATTTPGRADLASMRRAALSLGGMLSLFGAGAFLLTQLPPQSLLWGFLTPFAVIVLKAASMLLLGSAGWRRLIRSGRTGGGMAALLVAGTTLLPLLAAAALQEHGEPPADTTHAGAPAEQGTPTGQDHGDASHGAAAGDHGGGEHGQAQGPQKFANFITVLSRAFPDQPWARFLHEFEAVIFSTLVAALIILIAWLASRRAQLVPTGLQNAVEMLVESLRDFIVGILGPHHGPRYVPFLGTLFIYILAMNLFGLIPFMDSPTSSLNVTVALAITVFLYAQAIGLKRLGFVGWLDHLAGSPRSPMQWGLVPLMLPIHVLGEFAKPISLAARLFGNVFGEDMLLVAFATIGVMSLSFAGVPFGLPLQLPFMVLALLTGTLQALVFTVLSTIYFLLMLPHDDHDEHAEERHSAAQGGGLP